MKKNNNGFTLVEIVVVVVILAVLAAFLIPAMVGYLTTKNDEKNQEKAKDLYNSAQIELYSLYAEASHDDNYKSVIKVINSINPEVKESAKSFKYNGVNDSIKVFVTDIHNKKNFPVSAEIFRNAGNNVTVNNNGQWKNDNPCCVMLIAGDYKTYCSPELDTFNPKKAYTIYAVLYNNYLKGDFFLLLNDGSIIYPESKDELLYIIKNIVDDENPDKELVKQIYILKGGAGDDQNNETMWNFYANGTDGNAKKSYEKNKNKK